MTLAVDMLNRLQDVRAFYTDWGLMPRAWAEDVAGPLRLSLHFANGDAWFQVLLLLIEALAALCFALGYRARLATAVAFVLQISLLNRNAIILLGGDVLISCLLFWSLFVPVAARWSMDAALAENPPPEDPKHFSAGSVGLLVQVLSVWFFSSLLKTGHEWWPDGTAVYYAMSLDRYRSPLGALLLPHPLLMQGLSYFVYFLEMLGPPLALSPVLNKPLRFTVMLCLAAMHAGFIVFMEIGLFPFVSLSSLCVLLGGWWWDWAGKRVDHGRHLKIYYDGDCAFCLKSCLLFRELLALPRTDILPAQGSVRAHTLMQAQYSWVVIDGEDVAHTKWSAFVALLRQSLLFAWLTPLFSLKAWERPGVAAYDFVARHRGAFGVITGWLWKKRAIRYEVGRGAQVVAAVYVAAVLAWNLVTVKVLPFNAARAIEILMFPLRLDQSWPMFAPYPVKDDGWFVIPGALEDGTEVDLWTGKPVDWQKPGNIAATEPNVRWRTYHTQLWFRAHAENRQYYARWLCRDWNRSAEPGKHLLSLKIIYMLENTPPPGGASTIEQRVLWRHDCVAKPSPEAAPVPVPEWTPSEPERAPGEEKRPV